MANNVRRHREVYEKKLGISKKSAINLKNSDKARDERFANQCVAGYFKIERLATSNYFRYGQGCAARGLVLNYTCCINLPDCITSTYTSVHTVGLIINERM